MPDGDAKWRLTEIKRELCMYVSPVLIGTKNAEAMIAMKKVMSDHIPAIENSIKENEENA